MLSLWLHAIFLQFATCNNSHFSLHNRPKILNHSHARDHTKFTSLNLSVQNVHFLDAEDDINFSLKLVETLK